MSWLDPHEWAPLDGKSDWRDDPANAWCKVCDRGLEACTHEPGDLVRCPKCGGPDPFHDPACVVHPDLIQDHNEQEQAR